VMKDEVAGEEPPRGVLSGRRSGIGRAQRRCGSSLGDILQRACSRSRQSALTGCLRANSSRARGSSEEPLSSGVRDLKCRLITATNDACDDEPCLAHVRDGLRQVHRGELTSSPWHPPDRSPDRAVWVRDPALLNRMSTLP